MLHIIPLLINDLILILLKKAHDKYIEGKCKSSCFGGSIKCCIQYIEKTTALCTPDFMMFARRTSSESLRAC